MKATMLAGALAALMWGTTAGAQDVSDAEQGQTQDPQSQAEQRGIGGSGAPNPEEQGASGQSISNPAPLEQGQSPGFDTSKQDIGGSGQEPGYDESQQGVGGSEQQPGDETNPQDIGGAGQQPGEAGEASADQVPVQANPGYEVNDPLLDPRVADVLRGSGIFGNLNVAPPPSSAAGLSLGDETVPPPPPAAVGGAGPQPVAYGGSGFEPERHHPADMRGVTVLVGGGIEGYTGSLAPDVNLGATAGVTANFRPSRVLGLELGYSGALNEIDPRFVGTAQNGADIIRNGGQAAITLGFTATPLQPYALGGVGFSYYNVRNGQSAGFQDDTVGTVPVALGVRSHVGHFTADARLGYNFLFDQQFAPTGSDTGGSYTGTVNLGGTF